MDLLEIPLEPFLSRHSAAVVAASLWPWLAVLTAALSLWRIRSSGSKPLSTVPIPEPTSPSPAPPRPAPISPPASYLVADEGPTPKARFTARYADDDAIELDEKHADAVASDTDSGLEWETSPPMSCSVERVRIRSRSRPAPMSELTRVSDSGLGWEWSVSVPVRRKADLGWYGGQDTTALNGSVVRLWDGELTAGRRWRL